MAHPRSLSVSSSWSLLVTSVNPSPCSSSCCSGSASFASAILRVKRYFDLLHQNLIFYFFAIIEVVSEPALHMSMTLSYLMTLTNTLCLRWNLSHSVRLLSSLQGCCS